MASAERRTTITMIVVININFKEFMFKVTPEVTIGGTNPSKCSNEWMFLLLSTFYQIYKTYQKQLVNLIWTSMKIIF